MITRNNLPKTRNKSKKRLGRGYGSGKGGHTSSRGQKGQRTRSKIHPLFEGQKTKKSLIQRLPLLRGKGKNNGQKSQFVTTDKLALFENGETVNIERLVEKGLLNKHFVKSGVKIIKGKNPVTKKLTIKLPVSAGASLAITNAGGNVSI